MKLLKLISSILYILLIFIECLLSAKHDAEPHEKQKIVGFLSILKEPVGGNREKGTERKRNSKRKEESKRSEL